MADAAEKPARIVGYAIVSDDGMLADANGVMPTALKFEADWKYFCDGLDKAEAVIHGRHSHEQQPHSDLRHRITVTTAVKGVAPDPENKKGILWNPAGASFEQAWAALGLRNATLGVIGGTRVFGMFLDRYDAFHLSHAPGVTLPGGRPVFPDVPRLTPSGILKRHGLAPAETKTLDAKAGVTVTVWRRTK